MHHLPEYGSPEREALIRRIALDPVRHCREVLANMGTPEVDALLASLGRTKGLDEDDPYGLDDL